MYEARSRDQWNHTASVMAAAMQPHSRKTIDPRRLNPWERDKAKGGVPLSVGGLAAALGLKKKT